MFFKDIENWTDKKLKLNWLIFNILYLALVIIVPIIIVSNKYNITKDGSTKFTLVGFILVLFISVFLFKYGKRLLSKLPQVDKGQQTFKFMFLLAINIMIPVMGLVLIYLIKQNVELACNTIKYCLYSIISGVVIDHLTIKFIEAEFDLRAKADEAEAVDRRKGRNKK